MKLWSSLLCLPAFALLLVWPAHAGISVHADAVVLLESQARDVSMSLAPAADGSLKLDLRVASMDVAALGWRNAGLECHGTLARAGPGQWRFTGDIALHGVPGGALDAATVHIRLDDGENTLTLVLEQRHHRLQVAWPLDDFGHMQVHLENFPVRWLQGLLAQAWSQGSLGQGQLDARLSVDVDERKVRSSGRYALANAGFDSEDGRIAGADIDSQGHWTLVVQDDTTHLDLNARLKGGELLLGPLYASLPETSTRVRLGVDIDDSGIVIKRLHFDDGGMLRFDGRVAFDADGQLRRFRIDGLRAVFPGAYQHYGKALLASAGFPDLEIGGMITASGAWNRSGWQRVAVNAKGLEVHDPAGRIGTDGLMGRIDWSREGTGDPGHLSWNSVTVLGMTLGPVSTSWHSRDGTLALAKPVAIPMLGGKFYLRALHWSPVADEHEQRFAASLAYTGIDLARLSTAFGWPPFEGTVAGAIPAIHYDGERLRLEGGVSVNVFGGFVDVTRLELAQPFAAAPVLKASVDFRGLRLKPMTKVFGFGSISGQLHGYVHELRMIAWRPVAFSARLRADEGGEISQQAINSISNLGGGGIVEGLQSTILSIFDNFNYDRIGLSCGLEDQICHMSGLEPVEGGGYLIVDGSGLPHISVIGHQHQVDWDTLVTRLKAATSGGEIKIE